MPRRTRIVRCTLAAVGLFAAVSVSLWALGTWPFDRPSAYTRIEEWLYLGEHVPEPPRGTQAVLNLCHEQDPYVLPAQLWEPIPTYGVPQDIAWLRRMVDFVDTQRRAGQRTYVHCQAGENRSALVVVAYLMFEHRWTRDQALAFVQSKRPRAQPDAEYMQLLLAWEQTLRSEGKGR